MCLNKVQVQVDDCIVNMHDSKQLNLKIRMFEEMESFEGKTNFKQKCSV